MLTKPERVQLAASCRDTDAIPKVLNAGQVVATPNGPVQVMHNGVLIAEGCYGGEWMTEIIRDLRGHHEPQEEVVFHELVRVLAADTTRPTMMELGAFWAYYSLWMLDRIPDTRVILVEPDPNNLAVGQTNLALNDRHAEVFQAAVGSAAELPQPFVCESDRQTRLVPTESLPSLLERFATERIDVLLLDVQGAELAFLEGGREVLEEHVRFIMVSTHHHSISGDPAMHQRCLQLLIELGAHVIAEHTVAESFSGDGLIVASFDQRDAQLSVPISYARASESLFGDPLDDFARSTVDRARLRERLDAALGDVALANAELKRATAARDAATAATARAQAELTKVKATATWRLRQKLLRSWAGRAVLRAGSRAIRPLSGSDRTTTDGQKDRPAL